MLLLRWLRFIDDIGGGSDVIIIIIDDNISNIDGDVIFGEKSIGISGVIFGDNNISIGSSDVIIIGSSNSNSRSTVSIIVIIIDFGLIIIDGDLSEAERSRDR